MQRPSLQTMLHWIVMLLICILVGVLAGVLVFAPFHYPASVAAAVAVFAGLLYGGLWIWRQRAAQRWGWEFMAAPFVLLLGVMALALAQLYNMGQFRPLTQNRVVHFERLVAAMGAAYPYFEQKQIDWEATVALVRPQIEAAQSDDEYFRAIAEMLAMLNDGHTSLLQPYPQITRLGRLAEIEGQTVVVAIGPTAEAAGLAVGDVVLAIDGQEVETAIAALPPQLRYGSTAWNRQDFALDHLLAVWGSKPGLEVTVQSANRGVHTVMLAPSPAPPTAGERKSMPLVQSKRLPSGIGWIYLGENFGNRAGRDMIAEFDVALAALMDAPALILDLRDNGGGSSLVANQIAGRFLAEPFVYGREYYRQRLPTRAWWLWSDRRVAPRTPIYTGPLVLLIDASTVSSAEEFVISLVDSGRAQTVGRQSGGSTGNPLVFQLPAGGLARFSTGDLRRIDGALIEGVGIQPNLPVVWTLEDVRQGRDPDLDAAVRLLRQRLSASED